MRRRLNKPRPKRGQHCIVLYLGIYKAPLEVMAIQRRFQREHSEETEKFFKFYFSLKFMHRFMIVFKIWELVNAKKKHYNLVKFIIYYVPKLFILFQFFAIQKLNFMYTSFT